MNLKAQTYVGPLTAPAGFENAVFKKSTLSPNKVWVPWCVEVAQKDGTVAVRSSRDSSKTTIYFDSSEWNAFIVGVKKGEFD